MNLGLGVCTVAAAFLLSADLAAGQTQLDLDRQEQSKADLLDARLNAEYRQLMSRYSAGDRAALQAAERAWLKYRDSDCQYEFLGVEGGSARPMIYSMCLQELTAERLKHLRYQATCKEGDLSCVEPAPR